MANSAATVRPRVEIAPAVQYTTNAFRDHFGQLTDFEWRDLLIRAIETPTIEGIDFPGFPDAELQLQLHGDSGESAVHSAFEIYHFVKSRPDLTAKLRPESTFLDFGSGWGRIAMMFLRDFDLHRFYGFEPHRAICYIARLLNPYVCFLNGDYVPDGTLPADRFDFVTGWSVFAHLSEDGAGLWLEELARATRPDARCVLSTWGERFLDLLVSERERRARGEDIHWYYQSCLDAAGDIAECRRRYRQGEMIWFGRPSAQFGEACFLPPDAVRGLLKKHRINMELVEFDPHSLSQDVFILRRL